MPAAPQPSSDPILNPDIYLNYFPPDVAKQFEFARNLFLVTLGALLSDMLISLPDEFTLVKKSGIRPIMVAYWLSRVSTLAFVLSCTIVKIAPEIHCNAQILGVAVCWVIATGSSSFLFLRRALAIFHHRKPVRYFYSCLYVVNVGISLVGPIGNRAGPIGQTGWCINTKVAPYVSATMFSRLVFDSCVFLGISYELATTQASPGEPVTWRTFITGKAYSRLVRAILRGGQQYYLMSVCSNLLIVLLIIIPGVPALYQAMFTIPDIALTSSMACRVLRNLKMSVNCTDVNMSTSIVFPSSEASVGTTDTTDNLRCPIQIPLKSESESSNRRK